MKIKMSKSQYQKLIKKAGLKKVASDYCSICDTRRPAGGTNHLVLNGGETWIEFCEECGKKTALTNAETGEKITVKELFDRSRAKREENQPVPEISAETKTMKITMSKSQWEEIGSKAGWMKTANGHGRFSGDLSDILEGQVLANKNMSPQEIAGMIRRDPNLVYLMREEAMTNTELMELIEETLQIYSRVH